MTTSNQASNLSVIHPANLGPMHTVQQNPVQNNGVQPDLIQFLQDDLALSDRSITLALQHSEQATNLLPMVLWQYGLITLNQLERIFDWLDNHRSMPQEVYLT